MSAELDSIGMFLQDTSAKVAELRFPSRNINIYQEGQNPSNSGDLLNYAEPWGGPQNRPYVDPRNPSSTEQDPSMHMQGERPETFPNAAPPEDFPVSTTNQLGQGWEKTTDPGAGDSTEPGPDYVFVKPRGGNTGELFTDDLPYKAGEPYEHRGEGEEQTFSDRVVYTASESGDKIMHKSKASSESIWKVVGEAIHRGIKCPNNSNKIKVASISDLYSFSRVSQDTLIHKSSKELWSISMDKDGSTVIEKLFDDNGNPVEG